MALLHSFFSDGGSCKGSACGRAYKTLPNGYGCVVAKAIQTMGKQKIAAECRKIVTSEFEFLLMLNVKACNKTEAASRDGGHGEFSPVPVLMR